MRERRYIIMRVENNFNNQYVNTISDSSGRRNSHTDKMAADSLVDDGISMEISERGRALAGEMQPFLDTYETTRTLLKGTGHIGSEKMINGGFTDVLAENYQNELQRIKENYSRKNMTGSLQSLIKHMRRRLRVFPEAM